MTEAATKEQTTTLHSRYPELGTEPLSIEPYISPEYFELEKEHIFKKVWQHVGRVEEIPNPGDYFVKDIPAANASIIIVRNRQGEVKAFHNVCSHRANKIVYGGRGNARRLFCKFHGWAYDLDGNLTGVPEEDAFFGLRKCEHGLEPVACDVWEGFIFVNLDKNPAMSLRDYLGPMFAGIEGYPFHKMTSGFAWSAVIHGNWKVALDANQETYHVAYIHSRSIAGALKKTADGWLRPLDGLVGEFHRRLSIGGNPESVYGNPKAIYQSGVAGNGRSERASEAALRWGRGGLKETIDLAELPEGLNWTRDPDWAFDINVVFPDFYLSLRPNYYQAYNFRPLSHNTTLFEGRVCYPEAMTVGARFYQEYMKCALRDVLLEDFSTVEHTQAALETRAKKHVLLQDYEIMIRHSVKVVDRLINEGIRAAGK